MDLSGDIGIAVDLIDAEISQLLDEHGTFPDEGYAFLFAINILWRIRTQIEREI